MTYLAPEHSDLACGIDWEASCDDCRRQHWPDEFAAVARGDGEIVSEAGEVADGINSTTEPAGLTDELGDL